MVGLSLSRFSAGAFTLIAALVLITPLCGLLFDCGCTWPWSGLESHCNIYNPDAPHQCPWCVSAIAGGVSVGLAILLGFLVSIRPVNLGYDVRDSALAGIQDVSVFADFSKRVMLGLLCFLMVAVATGWLSSYLQGYPYFVYISTWPV